MANYHYVNYRSNRNGVSTTTTTTNNNNSSTPRGIFSSSKVPFRSSVNPGQLHEITLGGHLECAEGGVTGLPQLHRQSSLGHVSPIRGRTMKEYDQQIVELKNENFNLKLRIYFLEERLQTKFGDSSDDIHKSNIELKIEVESLKKGLSDKQELLMKASSALEAMEGTHKVEVDEIQSKFQSNQRVLEEQIFRLQQALDSFQQKSNGDDSKREELYQQAFAPFVGSVDSDKDSKVNEWQLKMQNISEELRRMNEDLNVKTTRLHELEKNMAEKDNYIKEEEINNVKRHKFIQGLVTAVKNKEKQLSQLQEQFDLQSVELKSLKDRFNSIVEKQNGDLSENVPDRQNLQLELEKLMEEKKKSEETWADAIKRKDETINGIKSELQAEKQRTIDQLNSMQVQLQSVQQEFKQQLDNKEELLSRMKNAVDERNSILQNCLQMIGALKPGEKVTDSSVHTITELFKRSLLEKESKTESVLEERMKLLKEKDNEFIRSEDKENGDALKNAEELVNKLKSDLDNRNSELQDLRVVLQRFKDKEENENSGYETQKNKNSDFITWLKNYVERLLDENCCKLSDESNSSTLNRVCRDIDLVNNEGIDLEQMFTDLEYRVRTYSAKNKLLENQLSSVKTRVSTIRKLIDVIHNGDDVSVDEIENKDLEENLQVVFQGVKMMTNLNDLFRQQIQLNSNSPVEIVKKRNSFNPQLLMDAGVENRVKTNQNLPIDKRLSNVVIKRGGRNDSEMVPANAMMQLHDAHIKIENLKEKLSSTENTVHLLGTKLKHYRKMLQDFGQIPPSPFSTNENSPFKLNQSETAVTSMEDNAKSAQNDSRRSVSVDDLRVIQGLNTNSIEDNQALSAEDVLVTPFSIAERLAESLTSQKYRSKLIMSPYTPDSLVDYGQTGDVLELKEQVCRLKLLLEEKEARMSEICSEREIIRASTTSDRISQLLLKEQTLTPSEHNFSVSYNSDKSRTTFRNSECQVGDGVIVKIDQHQFENADEEMQWLQNVNAMLHSQLDVLISEIPDGRYSAYIQLQQQDINVLKNRLLDSHDACELLRIRLEELADFLEQLLRFDENGFLDVSQFTPQRVESLKRRIAESRELSHSLSHSLLVDVADTSNVTTCPDGYESLQHYSVIKDDVVERNKVLKKLRSQSWLLQEQIRMQDIDSGLWNNGSRLTTPEFDGLRTYENVISAEKELERQSGNYRRESLRDNVEPTKLNQSSCDDLILLLNPDQQQQKQHNTSVAMYARETPSGDTNSESQSQNSLSNNDNDIRALDSLREQAIMEEYVRHYTSRQFADDNDNRSSYHRTNHALSFAHHRGIQNGEHVSGQRPRGAVSPSDSESWSEPDRDVSQQRIGLELEEKSFNVSRERSHFGRSPKSLKMKNHSSSNAGSTTDQSHAYFSKVTNSSSSDRRDKNEISNLDLLQQRLDNLEELNKTLRSELKIYQTLHDNQLKANRSSSIGIGMTDSNNESKSSSCKDVTINSTEKEKENGGDKMRLILNEHLLEIRTLRLRFEESIRINDKLREKLEKRLVSRQLLVNGDDIDHLTMVLSEKECALLELERQLNYHCRKETELQIETQELHQQITDLNEKLSVANTHVIQMENEMLTRQEGSQKLKQANQGLQNSITHLQTAFADKERVVKELREANTRMQRTLETVDTLMTQQANELSEVYQERENMKIEMENELSKQKNLKNQVSELQEKMKVDEIRVKEMSEVYEKQVKTMVGKLEEKSKVIGEMEKVSLGLRKEIESKKEECDKVKVKFEELKMAVARTEKLLENEHGLCLSQQQKVNELSKVINDKENCLEMTKVKISDLESMLNKAEKDYIEQRDKSDALVVVSGERDKKIEHLEKIIEKMQLVIAEKKKTLERQLETAKCLELKVQQLNCSASQKEQEKNVVSKLEEKISRLEVQVKDVQDEAAGYKSVLQKQEVVYQDLQVKLDERGTAIRKLEDELRRVVEDNEKLQQQILCAKDSLVEISELNKSLKTELNIYEHLHKNISSKKVSPVNQTANSSFPVDLGQLLSEMQHLRAQLELSIQTNNALRGQLGEHFLVKIGDATANTDSVDDDETKTQSLPGNDVTTNLSVKKCASLPCSRIEPLIGSSEKQTALRRQSKSSDCLSRDIKQVKEKTDEIGLKRKTEGVSKLNLGKLNIGDRSPMDRSPSSQIDSHCIYSSPDLGIESDPSHFSSLERKMSDITEDHLWDIRTKQTNQHKNAKKALTSINTANNSNRKIKHEKSGGMVDPNDQLVCVIGCLSDYDSLKKEIESGVTVMKGLQTRLKERIQFCCKNSSLKNVEYTTLKEIQCKCNLLNTNLGKSLKVIGCFWTAMLPSQTISQSKDTKNPKLLQENLLLKKKLHQQKSNLDDALTKLAASNRLKEGMEKAIMKQLSKTHDVLKRAKGNLEDQAIHPKVDK